MTNTRSRALVFLAALVAATTLTSPVRASPILDPIGDNFGTMTHDITSFSGEIIGSPNVVRFTIDFAGPISPASALAADSIVGYIDIDTDRNPLTGNTFPNVTAVTGIPFDLGSEVYVDLFSELINPGFVDVLDATSFALLGSVPITYSSSSLTFDVPVAFLGGNQVVNYAIVVGDLFSANDVAPNGPTPATTTPQPGTLALFALAGLAMTGHAWRRRRNGLVIV